MHKSKVHFFKSSTPGGLCPPDPLPGRASPLNQIGVKAPKPPFKGSLSLAIKRFSPPPLTQFPKSATDSVPRDKTINHLGCAYLIVTKYHTILYSKLNHNFVLSSWVPYCPYAMRGTLLR